MKPVITKEHGSWAVVFIPLITGAAASSGLSLSLIPFILCILFLFMSYTPAEMLIHAYVKKMPESLKLENARRWFYIYFLSGAVSGLALMLFSGKYGLLLYGAAAVFIFLISMGIVLKYRKNVWSDLAAMAGLTLSAPAAMYLLDGSNETGNLIVWLLNFAFFGSSAFYVHFKIKLASLKKQELSMSDIISTGRLNIIYHSVLFVILVALILTFPGSEFMAAAFLPMIIHVFAGTFSRKGKADFKKMGLAFLLYSFVFALCIGMAI